MRKIAQLLAVLMMCSVMTFSVNAESLEGVLEADVKEQVVQVEEAPEQEDQSQHYTEQDRSFIDNLQGIDLTKDQTVVGDINVTNELNTIVYKLSSTLVQVLQYALVCFLTVRIVLDMVFIAIPFTRGFLNGGEPLPHAPAMRQPMGQNMMGQPMGQQMGQFMAPQEKQPMGQPGQGQKVQWVQDSARNAIADPSPWSTYFKETVVTQIMTGLLLVLAITGVLTKVGFIAGEAIARIIQNI